MYYIIIKKTYIIYGIFVLMVEFKWRFWCVVMADLMLKLLQQSKTFWTEYISYQIV